MDDKYRSLKKLSKFQKLSPEKQQKIMDDLFLEDICIQQSTSEFIRMNLYLPTHDRSPDDEEQEGKE